MYDTIQPVRYYFHTPSANSFEIYPYSIFVPQTNVTTRQDSKLPIRPLSVPVKWGTSPLLK